MGALLRPDLLALAWAMAAALMAGLWLVQKAQSDASLVDAGWAAGLGMSAALLALLVEAPSERRLLVAGLAGAWSMRLTLHLYLDRVRGKPEDGRYRKLRADWGPAAQRNFFLFFQAQALLVAILSVPYVLALTNPRGALGPADLLGTGLVLVSVLGETVADRQLARFRADPAHRGRTCRAGLWRYSRHPNYFFEWLQWWAWPAMAWGSPLFLAALGGPALMLFFLFKVTGIPPTEARALETRGEDYRRYQRTTSVFVPWFPRSEA
jgi:steroid 5-alpha reductase family enzyme